MLLLPSAVMTSHLSLKASRAAVALLMAAAAALLPLPPAHADRVKPELFGMDLIQQDAPLAPLESTPTMRLIVNWSSIERSEGYYDWSELDARLSMAKQNRSKPLLTLYGTPSFHVAGPRPGPPDYVLPPKLSAYRAFVRALAERYGSRVDYQLWAEMNVPGNYYGPIRHMAKMARIAAQEVHDGATGALVVAPQGPIRFKENRDWFRGFWSERVGGKRVGKWVDVATLSGFPLPRHGPEKGIRLVTWLRRITAEQGFSGPIWIVEINYDVNGPRATVPISMDRQVANVVKTYVLNASVGTERVYWHYWSTPVANMNTAMLTADKQVAPPGKAFGVIQPWLVGTRAEGCTTTRDGDLYSCLFTINRVERRVLWSVSGRERLVAVPDHTKKAFRPDGTVRVLGGSTRLRVGTVPVMVESWRRPAQALD